MHRNGQITSHTQSSCMLHLQHPCHLVSKQKLMVLMAFICMQHLTGAMDVQSRILQHTCWPGPQLASTSSPGPFSSSSERASVSLLQVRIPYALLSSREACFCFAQCIFPYVPLWLLIDLHNDKCCCLCRLGEWSAFIHCTMQSLVYI